MAPSTSEVPVPSWVCAALKLDEDHVAYLEVNSENRRYKAFLDYLAHRAVDVREEPPEDEPGPATERRITERELSGKLSSLALAEECSNVPDSVLTRIERMPSKIMGGRGRAGRHIRRPEFGHDLFYDEQKSVPPQVKKHFGYGKARVRFEECDIYASHVNVGEPVGTECISVMHRVLYLYAADCDVLRRFADSVIEWNFYKYLPVKLKAQGKYELYTLKIQSQCGQVYWESQGLKNSRALESVILPDSMLESIVSDFREFSAEGTRSWYVKHGLPHRRSYLFYGPPGVGKTSTIRAVAGVLQLPTCFLSLGDDKIGNPELQTALSQMPKPGLLVMEDVDSLFTADRKSNSRNQLTFSGFLNSLDGLVSCDGILTILTTNHKEKLDPALTRAGRVDRKFEFTYPDRAQIAKLFRNFYPESDEKLAKKFAAAVFEREEKEARSIATLQEHFIYTRGKSAEESVALMDEFFAEFYPNNGEQANGYLYL